jgi:hypothetical protein
VIEIATCNNDTYYFETECGIIVRGFINTKDTFKYFIELYLEKLIGNTIYKVIFEKDYYVSFHWEDREDYHDLIYRHVGASFARIWLYGFDIVKIEKLNNYSTLMFELQICEYGTTTKVYYEKENGNWVLSKKLNEHTFSREARLEPLLEQIDFINSPKVRLLTVF